MKTIYMAPIKATVSKRLSLNRIKQVEFKMLFKHSKT